MALSAAKGLLFNLDTELDCYTTEGTTSFVGNRDTRTHIKTAIMGANSNTHFGLMNLNAGCNIDEARNALGPNRCNQHSQCYGDRYCSASGWCNGSGNCPATPAPQKPAVVKSQPAPQKVVVCKPKDDLVNLVRQKRH